MKIEDLLKMDMGECVEWLIENQYDFDITKKPMFDRMPVIRFNSEREKDNWIGDHIHEFNKPPNTINKKK
jgi:hypothetical protein